MSRNKHEKAGTLPAMRDYTCPYLAALAYLLTHIRTIGGCGSSFLHICAYGSPVWTSVWMLVAEPSYVVRLMLDTYIHVRLYARVWCVPGPTSDRHNDDA